MECVLPAIDNIATERLFAYADGDARRLLNTLETLAVAATQEKLAEITDVWVLKVLGERMRRYDKGGDPDAALYWLVRMLDGGADTPSS